jgi:hypothetical protein
MPNRNLPLHLELQRYHWYELAKRETGFSNTQMNKYPDRTYDSKTAGGWQKREHAPSEESIDRFGEIAPKSYLFFQCAPYRLLADERLEIEEISDLISVYRGDAGSEACTFPNDGITTDSVRSEEYKDAFSLEDLRRRGDIYAFFEILARVRDAEAKELWTDYVAALRTLYACLPSLGRDEWLREDFGLMCRLVRDLQHRTKHVDDVLVIDWYIVEDQFNDPEFEPDPAKRPTDPMTGKPIAIAEPTHFLSAKDIGQPPFWLGEGHSDLPEELDALSVQLDYDGLNELFGDQILWMAYMQAMELWGIGKSDWASCLGVEYSTISTWQSTAQYSFGIVPRTRVLALIIIRDILHRVSDYRKGPREYVRRPQAFLNGGNIVGALKNGHIFDVLSAFVKNPEMPSHNGPKGMLPVIPTGVLRLGPHLADAFAEDIALPT